MPLTTMTTIETIYCVIGAMALMAFLTAIAADFVKHDESTRPAPRSPETAEDGPKRLPVKPATVRRCKCGRIVSYKKITGDKCAYCHVENTPVPETRNPREPVKAIPAEVKEDA